MIETDVHKMFLGRLEDTLDKMIEYLRRKEKDFREGRSETSGLSMLYEMLQHGIIKLDLYLQIFNAVVRYDDPFEIKIIEQ